MTWLRDKEHISPDCAEILSVTVLLKPLTVDRVTLEFPGDPAFTVKFVGLATIAKSTTWNVIVAL